jgi:hypothetical protein
VATQVNKVRIFVASPGDVQSEREQLFKVINELNLTISALAPEKGIGGQTEFSGSDSRPFFIGKMGV